MWRGIEGASGRSIGQLLTGTCTLDVHQGVPLHGELVEVVGREDLFAATVVEVEESEVVVRQNDGQPRHRVLKLELEVGASAREHAERAKLAVTAVGPHPALVVRGGAHDQIDLEMVNLEDRRRRTGERGESGAIGAAWQRHRCRGARAAGCVGSPSGVV